MKKIIASITMLAAGAALASTVTSAQTFGVLKITSNTAETAISVPWVAAGSSGAETIKVVDFVKTSNLHIGDRLLKYDASLDDGNGGFYCWALTADAGSWQASNTAYNKVFISSGSLDEPLTRGDSIILVRGATSLAETDHAIYLYGQYKDITEASYSIPRGKNTLFAPINTTGNTIYLNASDAPVGCTYIKWGTGAAAPANKDIITLQWSNGQRYDISYNGSAWTHLGGATYLVIQPGMGAWYTAGAGSDNITAELATKAAE